MQVVLNINIALDSEKEDVAAVQRLLAGLAGVTTTAAPDPAVIAHISPAPSNGSSGTSGYESNVRFPEPGGIGTLDMSMTRPRAVVTVPAPTSAKHRAQKKLKDNQAAVVDSTDAAQLAVALVDTAPASTAAVTITRKQVEDAVMDVARKTNTATAIELVKSFGVQRVSDLTDAQYPELLARAAAAETAK